MDIPVFSVKKAHTISQVFALLYRRLTALVVATTSGDGTIFEYNLS
jgi:hypothetical protein